MTPERELAVGARVQFADTKQWWEVRAASDDNRFVILTRWTKNPARLEYTIIDHQRGVRGPDNLIFCPGYTTAEQVAARIRELVAGELEVSQRPSRYLELDIVAVKP
ncbi:hypothetical protein GS504_00965 [Rhodococcus hoagii]|nr:hypothetical protein [Prescottella equi]NKS72187.1 hypothetical protein [Prescottella equi]